MQEWLEEFLAVFEYGHSLMVNINCSSHEYKLTAIICQDAEVQSLHGRLCI